MPTVAAAGCMWFDSGVGKAYIFPDMEISRLSEKQLLDMV